MGQADDVQRRIERLSASLRQRAANLFALALQARERRDEAFSDELVDAANADLEHAERVERETKIIPPSPMEGGAQHVAQQQPEPD